MSTIIMSKIKDKADPSIRTKAYAFLEKLSADDTLPGLHVEPIANSVDPKVRTGRVDQFYRAVLFKLTGQSGTSYVYHGVWPHDDAIEIAKKTRLALNPVNGVAEITVLERATEPGLAPGVTESTPAPAKARPPDSQVVDSDEDESDEPPLGWVHVDALTGLGIEPSLAERATQAPDEDALSRLINGAVPWQGDVLMDLATGSTIADVQERLQLSSQPAPAPAETNDDALLDATKHPAAQMEFAWIEDNDELRRVIEDGDFSAWRVFLHPEQRAEATRDTTGPSRLSGGAGTGKTVIIMHRTRHLARQNPRARIVVTTFTTNLADQLKSDLHRLDPNLHAAAHPGEPGVYVGGIDALAYAVLRQAGTDLETAAEAVLGTATKEVTSRTESGAWRAAIDNAGDGLPDKLRSPSFFAAEYAHVVLPNRIIRRDDYFTARRTGRGVALNRGARAAVWEVVKAYRSQARIAGTIDFAEAAAIAAVHLERVAQAEGRFLADHTFVDEGQDLSPTHWQLLRALADEHADDLFIAEDSHQRIYGQHVTLSHYGIKITGRSRRLRLNYRTTAQNLAWAIGVLRGADYSGLDDEPDSIQGYRSSRRGPQVDVHRCDSLTDELDHAASVIDGWLKRKKKEEEEDKEEEDVPAPETLAILVRDRLHRNRVAKGLAERGVDVREVDREPVKPGRPVVMTMHRAKGMEFARVLLFGISDTSIPAALNSERYDETAWADAMLRERSLLYVAASRARDRLVVSFSGDPSGLLPAASARGNA